MASSRLEAAKQFGADIVVNNAARGPDRRRRELHRWSRCRRRRSRRSGVPATFELADGARPSGGHVANIGVHGQPVTLHLERLWDRDVTLTTGLVDTYSTATLMRLLTSRQLDARRFVTHRFGLDEFLEAYDVFGRASETGALKVALSREGR